MKNSQKMIKSGEKWLDMDGEFINAHGGGILFHEGTYFWYGEAKTGETVLPECNRHFNGCRVDMTGISCYRSTDLFNWKNEGLVLGAEADAESDLHKDRVVERPKVIYNKKTKKFVLWFHADSIDYLDARVGVAVSDTPTGKFVYQGSFRPNGNMSRDFTVYVDDDEKGYILFSSEDNQTMHIAQLTDDYQNVTERDERFFVGRYMEAPAVIKKDGRYHLMASDCTGWAANPSRSAVADSIWGPWTEKGNPCIGEGKETTYDSQSTYIQKIEGMNNAYIYMGDRWNERDLPESRYVWLPFSITEESYQIEYFEEWDFSVFNK
jgi:hypothetical protein